MRPEDTDQNQPQPHSPAQKQASESIVRGQIDTIYNQQVSDDTAQNPYFRTHQEHVEPDVDQWKQYHSAWQDYYQKYYERYYTSQLHQAHQAISSSQAADQEKQQIVTSNQPETETISTDEALQDLRGQLLLKVKDTSKKVQKSRHFIPIASAVVVMLLFVFVQFNQLFIANVKAYVSPGNIEPQNILVDPELSTSVDPDLTNLIIPKINVDVPVDYDATPAHKSQMDAMKRGAAYFGIPGANSKPGQVGNTPISAHSSNDVFESGNYKFIFAQLEKLKKDDIIHANYKGTRYTYSVTKMEVVKPSEVTKLVYKTDKPVLTLITCTPLGTAEKRLLVTAEQINPSPAGADSAPESNGVAVEEGTSMAGTAPTLFERLFGGR